MAQKSGMGPALRRMMGHPPPPVRGTAPARDTALMNGTRLRLFEAICNLPCSHLRALARALGIAPPSVLWHLDRLILRGVVLKVRSGNRSVYCLPGMLQQDDVGMLAFLGTGARLPAVRSALENPGLRQGELLRLSGANSHTLSALVARGLLEVLRDGRQRRYYPAPSLVQKRELYGRRARRFRQRLLSRLAEEGLEPEPGRYDGTFLEVRVTLGNGVSGLRLRCNPFALGPE